ncbi:MAG: class I SAM-dependent methyltransferase [Desulfarculaceae bacterium]|nr:class I SAM-dependent methyltransferase [Desulfarculaceae bacterium]MCF8072934.1 class I SAM-dependent methyltransferase [Desulfarculaceae bacterium]MCF8101102.1 class I SAM-dependent methyltransferase [Desulfarculaceae bacterium]MCF8115511.1 class I SAM-dependent methyltransferase [Desulfarculaceae bacterium]
MDQDNMKNTANPSAPAGLRERPTISMLSTPHDGDFEEDWYDTVKQNHFWMEWRFRAAKDMLGSLGVDLMKPAMVLDVGGGHGVVRSQIESCSAWQVDIADLALGGLERCESGRGDLYCYDVLQREPQFAGRYDFLLLFDVLEHIEDTREFLDAILFHLRPGGRIILNVPALPAFYCAFDSRIGHFRRYDKKTLANELAGPQIQIEELRYWGFSLVPALIARYIMMKKYDESSISGSQPVIEGVTTSSPAVNSILSMIMKLETRLSTKTPLGTSLLCCARKLA